MDYSLDYLEMKKKISVHSVFREKNRAYFFERILMQKKYRRDFSHKNKMRKIGVRGPTQIHQTAINTIPNPPPTKTGPNSRTRKKSSQPQNPRVAACGGSCVQQTKKSKLATRFYSRLREPFSSDSGLRHACMASSEWYTSYSPPSASDASTIRGEALLCFACRWTTRKGHTVRKHSQHLFGVCNVVYLATLKDD